MKKVEFKHQRIKIPETTWKGVDLTTLEFPCLCSFFTGNRHPGIIHRQTRDSDSDIYELFYVVSEANITNSCKSDRDLLSLLRMWDVEWEDGVIIYDNY